MIKAYCDRCHAEIAEEQEVFYIGVAHTNGYTKLHTIDIKADAKHFYCTDCMNAIKEFIKNKPEEKEEPEKKRKLDIGKVMALKNAGWSVDSIADEMGYSKGTIYNAICDYKKKAEKEEGRENDA